MPDHADVKLLPPLILFAGLAVGLGLALYLPQRLLARPWSLAVGLFFVAAAVLLAIAAVREMRRAETALDVRKPTTAIVTRGVFGATRNPIYLGMLLLHVGIAFVVNSPWLLLTAVPVAIALHVAAVRPEERYLEAKFGETYIRYRAGVPRWFGARSLLRHPAGR